MHLYVFTHVTLTQLDSPQYNKQLHALTWFYISLNQTVSELVVIKKKMKETRQVNDWVI